MSAQASRVKMKTYTAPPHLRFQVPGANEAFNALDNMADFWGCTQSRRLLPKDDGLEFLEPPSPLARFAWLATPSCTRTVDTPCAACAFQAPLFAEVIPLDQLMRDEHDEAQSDIRISRHVPSALRAMKKLSSVKVAVKEPHHQKHRHGIQEESENENEKSDATVGLESADPNTKNSDDGDREAETETDVEAEAETEAEAEPYVPPSPTKKDLQAMSNLEVLMAHVEAQMEWLAAGHHFENATLSPSACGVSLRSHSHTHTDGTRAEKIALKSTCRPTSHPVVVPTQNLLITQSFRGRRLKEQVPPRAAPCAPQLEAELVDTPEADDGGDAASASDSDASQTSASLLPPRASPSKRKSARKSTMGDRNSALPDRNGSADVRKSAAPGRKSAVGRRTSEMKDGVLQQEKQRSIEFTLDGAKAADSGWTLQTVDDPNVFDPALQTYRDWASGRACMFRCHLSRIAEAAPSSTNRSRTKGKKDRRRIEYYGLAERPQTKFLTMVNKSGTVHWPSGRRAVCISTCDAGLYAWAFRDSAEVKALQFYSTPYGDGCVLWPNGNPHVLFNQQTLTLYNQNGNKEAQFRWDSIPFMMPIELQPGLKVHISSSKQIVLELSLQAQAYKISVTNSRNWLRVTSHSRPLSTVEMKANMFCTTIKKRFDAMEEEVYDTLCGMWDTFLARQSKAVRAQSAGLSESGRVPLLQTRPYTSALSSSRKGALRRGSSLAELLTQDIGTQHSRTAGSIMDVGKTLKDARAKTAKVSRNAALSAPAKSTTHAEHSKITRYELARLISHSSHPKTSHATITNAHITPSNSSFAVDNRPHTAPGALGLEQDAFPPPPPRAATASRSSVRRGSKLKPRTAWTTLWDPKHVPVVTDSQLLALLDEVPAQVMVIVVVSDPLARRVHPYENTIKAFHKSNCTKHAYRSKSQIYAVVNALLFGFTTA